MSRKWIGIAGAAGLAVALAACAPGSVSGAFGGMVGLALALSSLALFTPRRAVNAGPPAPCEGDESSYCWKGRVGQHCCPKNADCNYRDDPYLDCGNGLCTRTRDPGRCPAPTAFVGEAASEAACKQEGGSWELVCAKRVVTYACIPPVPTNYTGPSQNPPFEVCGQRSRLVSAGPPVGERCTTHRLIEDCYPTEAELGFPPCPGQWQKVCIGGQVSERCMPLAAVPWEPRKWEAATFVTCDDGSCAVGQDRGICGNPKD